MLSIRTQPLRNRAFLFARFLLCAAAIVFFLAMNAYAQTPSLPAAILGQVSGDDVSVIGASHVISGAAHAIEFSSGGTIVVFSGKARVEFTGGGELDVCGPAKFTVLSSGEALTVALSFGRVRIRFDALRPIAIYMPLVTATPVPIGNQPRDATVGLTNTGTMCVLTSAGAVRLQNQLSGETAIVPQPSEVFVPGSSFTSLPPAVGQCGCDFDEPLAQQPAPATTVVSVPAPSPQIQKQSSPPSALILSNRSSTSETQSSVSSSQPSSTPAAPPIGDIAKSSTETPEPISVAMLMLAQQTVVQPDWIFGGTVVDSGAKKNHQSSQSSATQNARTQPRPKKRGFWAKLRHFLTGSQ